MFLVSAIILFSSSLTAAAERPRFCQVPDNDYHYQYAEFWVNRTLEKIPTIKDGKTSKDLCFHIGMATASNHYLILSRGSNFQFEMRRLREKLPDVNSADKKLIELKQQYCGDILPLELAPQGECEYAQVDFVSEINEERASRGIDRSLRDCFYAGLAD